MSKYWILIFVVIIIILILGKYADDYYRLSSIGLSVKPQNININSMKPTPIENSPSIFPEPNQPPYFYAESGGDWVKINGNWSIRLHEVLSDDRCPLGVKCETSGKGRVKVQFMQPDVDYSRAYFEELEVGGLNRWSMPDGDLKPSLFYPLRIERTDAVTSRDIGFTITLADLRPYPDKDLPSDIADTKYVGLFYVSDNKK